MTTYGTNSNDWVVIKIEMKKLKKRVTVKLLFPATYI